MADHDSFGSFFLGFIAGAIAGAVATVLYAPQSGAETRKIIGQKKEEFWEKANVSVDEAYKQAEIAAKEAKDKIDHFATITKNRADELSQKGQELYEDQLGKIKNTIQKAAKEGDIEIQA